MSRVWSVSVRPSPNRVSSARHSDAVLAQRKASLWLEQPLLMKLNGKRACLVHARSTSRTFTPTHSQHLGGGRLP